LNTWYVFGKSTFGNSTSSGSRPACAIQATPVRSSRAMNSTVAAISAAFVQAVRAPEVVKQMVEQGAEPVTDTPQEFAAYIDSEIKKLGTIVTTLGIKGE
jgi:hypothetical protein